MHEVYDLEAVLTPPEPEAVVSALEEARAADTKKEEEDSKAKTVPEQDTPDMVLDVPVAPVVVSRGSSFKAVCIPSWLEDLLGKISQGSFDQAMNYSNVCGGLNHFCS